MERNIPWTRTPRHKFDKAWPSGLTRSQNTIDFVTKCTAAYCKVHHGTPSKIGLQRSKTKGAPQLMKTWIVAPHFLGFSKEKGFLSNTVHGTTLQVSRCTGQKLY